MERERKKFSVLFLSYFSFFLSGHEPRSHRSLARSLGRQKQERQFLCNDEKKIVAFSTLSEKNSRKKNEEKSFGNRNLKKRRTEEFLLKIKLTALSFSLSLFLFRSFSLSFSLFLFLSFSLSLSFSPISFVSFICGIRNGYSEQARVCLGKKVSNSFLI